MTRENVMYNYDLKILFYFLLFSNFSFKGSDWLCKVVELSIQYCRKLLEDSFEPYKPFERSVNPEFERKVDAQNS